MDTGISIRLQLPRVAVGLSCELWCVVAASRVPRPWRPPFQRVLGRGCSALFVVVSTIVPTCPPPPFPPWEGAPMFDRPDGEAAVPDPLIP